MKNQYDNKYRMFFSLVYNLEIEIKRIFNGEINKREP